MIIKKHFLMLISAVACYITLKTTDETGVVTERSVQKSSELRMVEKIYRDKLKALKDELDLLKASILLDEPEVGYQKYEALQGRFDDMNRELAEKQLTGKMSRMFHKHQVDVERTIIEIKDLLKKPEIIEMLQEK